METAGFSVRNAIVISPNPKVEMTALSCLAVGMPVKQVNQLAGVAVHPAARNGSLFIFERTASEEDTGRPADLLAVASVLPKLLPGSCFPG